MGKSKKIQRDLQGTELINGVHKDLVNNPEYWERYKKMIRGRETEANEK
tara:strand:+ start:62 stop:208 length:147 start_codon:yes stop_codon:yes gene_type:complete